MKKALPKLDLLSLVVLASTFAVTALLYGRLPDPMPTHYNLRGVADGWSSRAFGAFLTPAIAVGTWLLTRLGARLLPSAWRERLERSPVAAVALLLALLFAGVQGLLLHLALGGRGTINTGLGVLLGLAWIGLGQLFPRLRRNPLIGIRTTWTLTSDENWARTHRFGGWTMTVGGLLTLLAGLAGSPWFILPLLASALVPAVYSFLLARREQRSA